MLALKFVSTLIHGVKLLTKCLSICTVVHVDPQAHGYKQEYIIERESIPLVAQPCEKCLSWEDGEKYVLDGAQGHKYVNHVNSEM